MLGTVISIAVAVLFSVVALVGNLWWHHIPRPLVAPPAEMDALLNSAINLITVLLLTTAGYAALCAAYSVKVRRLLSGQDLGWLRKF